MALEEEEEACLGWSACWYILHSAYVFFISIVDFDNEFVCVGLCELCDIAEYCVERDTEWYDTLQLSIGKETLSFYNC